MTMEEEEFNSLLQVLENPIRRQIVKRLSHGPSYALQLSKELGLGQALVAKHLTMMEEAGVVKSSREPSDSGPRRRTYSLARSISITLDMAPNLFIQRGFSFSSIEKGEMSAEDAEIMEETAKISGRERGDVSALSTLLGKVDDRLEQLQEERAALLYVRNKAMESASRAIEGVEGRAQKRVIYNILEGHDMDVKRLSQELDLREAVIKDILKEIRYILE
jgi:predicted transcriptional regulator